MIMHMTVIANKWMYYVQLSGIVVFTGINEDYYSLFSRADKHIGDTRVILATPSDDTVSVFLQRTAVTYR